MLDVTQDYLPKFSNPATFHILFCIYSSCVDTYTLYWHSPKTILYGDIFNNPVI